MELLKPGNSVCPSVPPFQHRVGVNTFHSVGVNTFPFISFSPCISIFQILSSLSCYMELLNLSAFIFDSKPDLGQSITYQRSNTFLWWRNAPRRVPLRRIKENKIKTVRCVYSFAKCLYVRQDKYPSFCSTNFLDVRYHLKDKSGKS